MNLTWIDFAIITVPFVVVLGITAYMQRFMRSVADFLAASRCAGRYLISTASTGTVSVVYLLMSLEVFSKTGFSLEFWTGFSGLVVFFMGVVGLVVYRFRETEALTFHQFFEIRYDKGLRVFASFLSVFSGLLSFGIQPAVGARFFVYFCNLPERISLGGTVVQTYIPLMLLLMGISLYFALSGGQISVMVTDCLEGLISSYFYLIIAISIVLTISVPQMKVALTSGPPSNSFVDPFDMGGRTDFNGWYVVLSMLLSIYTYRGNAWQQGFAAAARNAHEGRMAQVLGNWRWRSFLGMSGLVSIAAFTLLHNPDFAAQRHLVEQGVARIGDSQLQTQMTMPMALGVLMGPGVRGCFMAVLLFGLLASQGVQLHGLGSTVLQDVIMPLRKRTFAPKLHVRYLRYAVLAVAAFSCAFSIVFKPVDYLVMILTLVSSIYVGGVGLVVWGGLYWSRGTSAGAWASMIVGAVLGGIFNVVQPFWKELAPWAASLIGPGVPADYLSNHAGQCPWNGLELSAIVAAAAGTSYVVVSWCTCRQPFDLDRMLHRGQHRRQGEEAPVPPRKPGWLDRMLDMDGNFSTGDKVLTVATLGWTLAWKALALAITLYVLLAGPLSTDWWFHYTMVTYIWVNIGLGVVTTAWFTFGIFRDLKELFRTLANHRISDSDDGTVKDHRNAGDPVAEAAPDRSG